MVATLQHMELVPKDAQRGFYSSAVEGLLQQGCYKEAVALNAEVEARDLRISAEISVRLIVALTEVCTDTYHYNDDLNPTP